MLDEVIKYGAVLNIPLTSEDKLPYGFSDMVFDSTNFDPKDESKRPKGIKFNFKKKDL